MKVIYISLTLLFIFSGCGGGKKETTTGGGGDTTVGGYAYYPVVAMSETGNAIAIWQECDASNNNCSIRARSYVPSQGWSQKMDVDNGGTSFGNMSVSINSTGDGVLAWIEDKKVLMRRHINNNWDNVRTVDSTGADPEHVSAKINDRGDIILTWDGFDGTYTSVYADYFNSTTNSYRGKEEIDVKESCPFYGLEAMDATMPVAGMDNNGNAFVVFAQSNPCDNQGTNVAGNIYATIFNGSTWSNPIELDLYDWEGQGGEAIFPDLYVTPLGKAIACWEQTVPSEMKNHFFMGIYEGNWNVYPDPLDPSQDPSENARTGAIRCTMNDSKNGFAFFETISGTEGKIYGRAFVNGTWDTPLLFDSDFFLSTSSLQSVITSDGIVLNTWIAHNNVYARRVDLPGKLVHDTRVVSAGINEEMHKASLALTDSGKGVIVFEASNKIYASFYDHANDTWSAPEKIN